jgi:hypothetical protein
MAFQKNFKKKGKFYIFGIFSMKNWDEKMNPNRTELRLHLNEHFTALSTNLQNWHERTAYEGLLINIHQPTLNKQLKSQI